jgi:hypothetical protein
MTKFLIFNRQKFAEFPFYIFCIFLIILISGCEGDSAYTNQIPTATITSPEDGSTYDEGNIIIFDGYGTDTEDKNLSGSSLVWNSSIEGQIGTGTSFATNGLSIGSHIITLTVFDGDGASGSTSVSIVVSGSTSDNTPPTASITSPIYGADYNEGEIIVFSGSGTDAEDGNLTGSSLVWTSSIAGEIGTGDYFTLTDLSVGSHTITLTATDSHGAKGTGLSKVDVIQ